MKMATKLALGLIGAAASSDISIVPSQTLGAELLTNGNMESSPANAEWTPLSGGVGSDEAEERTGGSGVQSLRLTASAGGYGALYKTLAGGPILATGWLRNVNLPGGISLEAGLSSGFASINLGTTWQRLISLGFTNTAAILIGSALLASVGQYALADDLSAVRITPSPQQTAPSANHRATFTYTLPGSPVTGTTAWLMPRISDFTAGNYWVALLHYTGTRWDANLYSATTHSRTSRTSATNIGATVGMRVNCNANTLRLETTANGTTWTQRGTDVTNSTYNTATGVNVLYSSDVTPALLTITAAV